MTEQDYFHHTGTLTGRQGDILFTQHWEPTAPHRGNLLVFHGLGDHSGRYLNLVQALLPLGYSLFSLDHTGHGRSGGTPGHIDNFSDLLDPAVRMLAEIRDKNPHVPTFLFGHSLGGLLAVRLCQIKHPEPAGVILSNPSLNVPDGVSPLTIMAGRLLSRFLPKLPLSRLDPGMLSRDPEVVSGYQNDPLVYQGAFSSKLAATLLDQIDLAFEEMEQFTPPLLTLIGEQDRISFPADTRRFHEGCGSIEKTIITYPLDLHELINEPDHHSVLQDIAAWMDDRVPSS